MIPPLLARRIPFLCLSRHLLPQHFSPLVAHLAPHPRVHPTHVLGVPANGLAKLLAPKPGPLCGRPLEVTVEEGGRTLTFIGQPTTVSARQAAVQHVDTRGESFDGLENITSGVQTMVCPLLPGAHEALTTFTLVCVLSGPCR